MSTQPKGMARTALEREAASERKRLKPQSTGVEIAIQQIPLQDGRVRMVDRRTSQIVGVAINVRQAGRTVEFFS